MISQIINRFAKYLAGCITLTAVSPNTLPAQVLPSNYDTVNYRLVGLSIPPVPQVHEYNFELAAGDHTNDKDFKKNRLLRIKSETNQAIVEVPEFGKTYTWRVSYKGDKNASSYYHFSTGATPYADTSLSRLRIISNSNQYNNLLVILDHAPVMYDMKGALVWYLPDIPGLMTKGMGLRDIKPTKDGTFTMLNNYGAFEFDYNGNILWKAPDDGRVSGDTAEGYHHEVTKLNNGHYMVEGMSYISRRVPNDADTTYFNLDKTLTRKDGWFYKRIECPTLIEYDNKGNIVWSWKSSEYFTDKDYFTYLQPDGTYISPPHMNSFYLDEKENILYLGFRNLNRVIKMRYPSREVLAVYGEKVPVRNKVDGFLFRAQHCVRADSNGIIYMFNNNGDRERNVSSEIVKFKQPADPSGNLEKFWQFSCDIDSNVPGLALSGGSVLELPDGSILANMGMWGRTFIVTPDKKIAWNALPEFKTPSDTWAPQPEYRANYVEKTDQLRSFIFRKVKGN